MHYLAKINQTSLEGTSFNYAPDGTYLLTVNHPTSTATHLHLYHFSNSQISSYIHQLSNQDMQYPYSEDNYALRTFNTNAVCYIFGWGLSGGFKLAKLTYSKKKEKVEDIEFFYWDMIGRSDLKSHQICGPVD